MISDDEIVQKKKTDGYLKLDDWLECAERELAEYLNNETVILSLIGKDGVDRSKGEDINDLVKAPIFPSYTPIHETLEILAYYSPQHNTLFLVLNSVDDSANLVKVFATGYEKNFWEKLRESEEAHDRLLLFLFLNSHFVMIVEATPRFDAAMARKFKTINKMRLRLKQLDKPEENSLFERLDCPLLLFGFHRNNIRKFLGNAKKREIYEKLEQSIENQINSVLKAFNLVEASGDQSLVCIDEVTPFVHLISPNATLYNPLTEILALVMSDDFSLDTPSTLNSGSSFRQFFNQNIDNFFSDAAENKLTIPTLKSLIARLHSNACLRSKSFYAENEAVKNVLSLHTNKEWQFLNWLTSKQIDEAVEIYALTDSGKERDRLVFTRAEHDQKFSAAVNYLDSVLVGDRASAMVRLRTRCDQLWQGGMRGCEQLSLTGEPCQLPDHCPIGDVSVPEAEWTAHRSGRSFISTCPCGRTQAVRQDPFTLYEANYLFYAKAFFPCCRQLEKYQFTVVADDENEAEPQTEEWSNWLDKSNSFVDENEENLDVEAAEKDMDEMRLGTDSSSAFTSESESEYLTNSLPMSETSERQMTSRLAAAEGEDEAGERTTAGRRRPTGNPEEKRRPTPSTSLAKYTAVDDTTESTKDALITLTKRVNKLKNNKVEFLETMPHTLSPLVPPLFPSWVLTCIGSGRLYSHSTGLRDHPNFKMGCESLLPVDVHLQINVAQWERDMQYVQAIESTSVEGMMSRNRRPLNRRNMQFDTERVKLFVGFDYECPRGHRFFVTSQGDPLILPRSPVTQREALIKEAADGLLDADLPLRRECTCRRKPLQIAQLMRVHVVTPKAPVEVTLQPVIEIDGQAGQFITGESPLQLKWARYYILQLPFIYAGPSGAWLPPDSLKKCGTYKAQSIRVNYNPLIH